MQPRNFLPRHHFDLLTCLLVLTSLHKCTKALSSETESQKAAEDYREVVSSSQDKEETGNNNEEMEKLHYMEHLSGAEYRLYNDLQSKLKQIASDPTELLSALREKFRGERLMSHLTGKTSRFRSSPTKVDDKDLIDYAELPNLFGNTVRLAKQRVEENQSCSEAFQMYYDQSYAPGDPDKPSRTRMKLRGNESASEGWRFFFQTGAHGTEGYGPCFKAHPTNYKKMGRGPCAKVFQGKQCKFYPDFPIVKKFHPACCDGNGCFCECIHFCASKKQIVTTLEANILSFKFEKCTNSVKSMEQGARWKDKMCKASKGKRPHRVAKKECRKRGSKATCVRQGHCIKKICKFCFRWQCLDEIDKKGKKARIKERIKKIKKKKKACYRTYGAHSHKCKQYKTLLQKKTKDLKKGKKKSKKKRKKKKKKKRKRKKKKKKKDKRKTNKKEMNKKPSSRNRPRFRSASRFKDKRRKVSKSAAAAAVDDDNNINNHFHQVYHQPRAKSVNTFDLIPDLIARSTWNFEHHGGPYTDLPSNTYYSEQT